MLTVDLALPQSHCSPPSQPLSDQILVATPSTRLSSCQTVALEVTGQRVVWDGPGVSVHNNPVGLLE